MKIRRFVLVVDRMWTGCVNVNVLTHSTAQYSLVFQDIMNKRDEHSEPESLLETDPLTEKHWKND